MYRNLRFCLILAQCLHFVSSSSPPSIIITSIEHNNAISQDKNILTLRGANYLIFPKIAKVTLRCEAKFPIRWASSLPILHYDLPVRYASDKKITTREFPESFLYVSILTLNINGIHSKDDFVSCADVKGNISSSLIILGQGNYVKQGPCQQSLHLLWGNRWDTHLSNLGIIYYTKPNYQHGTLIGQFCSNKTSFKVDLKTEPSTSSYFSPISLESLKEKYFLEQDTGYSYCAGHNSNLSKRTQNRTINCKQYECSNPFFCDFVRKTTNPTDCDFKVNSDKVECLNNSESSILICEGIADPYYIFKRINSSLRSCNESLTSQLLKIEKRIETNGLFTFTCLGSPFVLGRQLIFSIRCENGSEKFLGKFSEDDISTELVDGILKNTLKYLPEPEVTEVICRAPRFDSDLWLNVSEQIEHAATTDEIDQHKNSSATTEVDNATIQFNTTSGLENVPPNITNRKNWNEVNFTEEQDLESLGIVILFGPDNTAESKNVNRKEAQIGDKGYEIWKIVIVVVVVVIIVALVTVCIVYGIRRYRSKHLFRQLTNFEMREFMLGSWRMTSQTFNSALSISPLTVPFTKEIQESELTFELGHIIDKDGFICTYPGSVNGRSAIVRTTDLTTTINFFLKLLKDIKQMQRVGQQPNIVELLGAVTLNIKDRVIYVAFESSPLGNVKEYLQRNFSNQKNRFTSFRDTDAEVSETIDRSMEQSCETSNSAVLLNWCEQIATGMTFLQNENLVHGDLNTSNVLLFPDNLIKITELCPHRQDFYREQYFQNFEPPPNWRWMAIELLRSKKFTIKSDVWAFGVTMWEILSLGEDPYPGIEWAPEFVVKLENGYRMEMPIVSNKKIFQILLGCWYRYPNDRLHFSKIQESIHDYQAVVRQTGGLIKNMTVAI